MFSVMISVCIYNLKLHISQSNKIYLLFSCIGQSFENTGAARLHPLSVKKNKPVYKTMRNISFMIRLLWHMSNTYL